MNNFIFHVVNSVKGGCGKSTFSLYLADYWAHQDNKVYIIDLDTDGTSWEEDFQGCFTADSSKAYLNDIIDNDQLHTKINVWRKLNSDALYPANDPLIDDNISICVANPGERKELREYQVDLFEQAVISLVNDDIISKNKWQENGNNKVNKSVHIIFDMPPGVEQKSERILNRWLLSQAIQKEENGGLVLDSEKPGTYEVRLYMVSTLATSSVAANQKYVEELFKPNNYCDMLNELCNNHALSIDFVLNDITQFCLDSITDKDFNQIISPSDMLKHFFENYLFIPVMSSPDEIKAFYFPFITKNPVRLLHYKIAIDSKSAVGGYNFDKIKGFKSAVYSITHKCIYPDKVTVNDVF